LRAPGRISQVLEATMIWQLLQVRHLQEIPLIFTGSMWRELVDWASRYMLRPGFALANAEDMSIPQCVDTADGAITIVRDHHAQWLSRQGAVD
jgi:predicted Rossmann-fold nucleotide-binding protein